MREIKFKAIIKTDDGVFVTPVLDWVDFANKTCDWTTYSRGTNEFEETESIYEELLQSTGLKDKNGREIYEGDVVKIDWLKNFVFEVKYKQGCYMLQSTQLMDNGEPKRCFYIFEINEMFLEIIGNIYETPELLEQEG